MAKEIELKLTLPQNEQRRFLRNPQLKDISTRRTTRLRNIYFDTPDLALHCNGIALRLRRSGRQWLQTVKCAGVASGGLAARPEWETPHHGAFDFSAIDDPLVRKRLDRLKHRLVPIFETNFQRISWTTSIGGTGLTIVLDRGTVTSQGRSEALSEVEVELGAQHSEDDIQRLLAFAQRLTQDTTLTPGLWSKAERGYRLFRNTPQTPLRAMPVRLDASMPPLAAFRRIAEACLDHLQRNHYGALHSNDPEYIHQMRVALRRLHAAMRLFKPLLPTALQVSLAPRLRELMRALGAARDLDVLSAEIVAPVVTAMPAESRTAALAAEIAARRHAARAEAVQKLGAAAYGQALLQAMTALHQLSAAQDDPATSLPAFAHARLKRLQRKVARLAVAARQDDPASLHQLRIAAKRLRYALEFFVPLLPTRDSNAYLKQLARLQNVLGQLNDLANAGTLLMDCADESATLREAVSLIGGWHGPRYAALIAQVPRTVKKLRTLPLPKMTASPSTAAKAD